MSKKHGNTKRPSARGIVVFAGIIAVAALAWLIFQPAPPSANSGNIPPGASATKPEFHPDPQLAPVNAVVLKAAANTNTSSALELQRREALFASFRRHPFPVAEEKDGYGWTSENGKDPDVIRQLAHNELEFERMAAESDRIYRRQLVYASETTAQLVQQSKLSEQPIQQLALPGLDGQVIHFNITSADLNSSGESGTFSGKIPGQPESMVTLAFKGGREAFTILSPADKLYLVGEPREPGEIIVKSINPATYVQGNGGDPSNQ